MAYSWQSRQVAQPLLGNTSLDVAPNAAIGNPYIPVDYLSSYLDRNNAFRIPQREFQQWYLQNDEPEAPKKGLERGLLGNEDVFGKREDDRGRDDYVDPYADRVTVGYDDMPGFIADPLQAFDESLVGLSTKINSNLSKSFDNPFGGIKDAIEDPVGTYASLDPSTKLSAASLLGSSLTGMPGVGLIAEGVLGAVDPDIPGQVTTGSILGQLAGFGLLGLPGMIAGGYLGRNMGASNAMQDTLGMAGPNAPGWGGGWRGALGFDSLVDQMENYYNQNKDWKDFEAKNDRSGFDVIDNMAKTAARNEKEGFGGGDGGGRDDAGHNTDGGRSDRADKDGPSW